MASLKLQSQIFPSAKSFFVESIISTVLCVATAVCVQAQNPQTSGGDESWTSTKETAMPNANPARTTESHTKSGNRTTDKQRLDILGPNGGYQPFSETETETVQVDATTTRTVVRTYRWDGNGRRTVAEIREEESRSTANGSSHMESKTSSADVNGNFQLVRREVADTRKVNSDVEETKSTVYRSDSYGGLTQVEQMQEVKTHGADDSVAVKRTTLVPDGNGNWKVGNVTEETIKDDGKNQTTEERVSRPDLEGRLYESSRTVTKEGQTDTGEKRKTVESYSVYGSGYTDGGMHLNQRVATIQKKDSGGEITEQQVEQPYAANPGDGPKVTSKTKYVVKYAASGTEQTKSVEMRDADGNFNAVFVETKKSTQPPPAQKPPAPADKP
jgi:hypothetical protein